MQGKNSIFFNSTFNRVWNLINPKEFEKCFQSWLGEVKSQFDLNGKVVAFDGKTMRGSAKKSKGMSGLHIVTAYATELSLTLGQVCTHEKSNEITAIPDLINTLYLKGCIVTIDAMGCQKNIANKIVDQGADAVLAVKENQPKLSQDIETFFQLPTEKHSQSLDFFETFDKGHGRIESRKCTVSQDLNWLHERHPDWPIFQSIIRIESERTIGKKYERHTRYFVSTAKLSATGLPHEIMLK